MSISALRLQASSLSSALNSNASTSIRRASSSSSSLLTAPPMMFVIVCNLFENLPNYDLYSTPLYNRLWTALYMSTIYASTILIFSSVKPYNSYTRRSILSSVDSISRFTISCSCGNRAAGRLCSSSMRSTSETSLSCRATSAGLIQSLYDKYLILYRSIFISIVMDQWQTR